MTITCFIRYQIDPFQRDEFKEYAENWGHLNERTEAPADSRKRHI